MYRAILTLSLLTAVCSRWALAQGETPRIRETYYRGSLLGGVNTVGSTYGTTGPCMAIAFAKEQQNLIYTARVDLLTSDFAILSSPHEGTWDLCALYGRAFTNEQVHWSYSGGLALVSRGTRGRSLGGWLFTSYEWNTIYGVGAVGQLEGVYTPCSFFGITGSVSLNLNTTGRSYGMAVIGIQCGNL